MTEHHCPPNTNPSTEGRIPFLSGTSCLRVSLAWLVVIGLVASVGAALAAPCVCAPPDSLGWWRAENNADDSAGSNNGTLQNGVTFAAGILGQAFNLNGVNQYVEIPDAPSLRPANLTIEGWFKFAAADSTRLLVSKSVGTGIFDSFQVWMDGGLLRGAVGDLSGFGPFVEVLFVPDPSAFYHIAYTFDDATDSQVLYLNGSAIVSGATTKTIGYDSNPVLIGADLESGVPSFFFSGLADEVSIRSRALSALEIEAIFNAGGAGDQLPPVLTCPANTSANCTTFTDTGVTGVATAVDGCDPSPVVSFTDSTTGAPCAGTLTVMRTWTATDCSGNTASCVQTITVNAADTTNPTVTCPAGITVMCGAPTDPSATGTATATDDCDPNPTVTFSDSVAGGPCPAGSIITRTWTATDCSGNMATCVQVITVTGLTGGTCLCDLSGIIGLWKGEGNANDSVNGNHGTAGGGTAFAAGQLGQAFSMDGLDDLVSIPDSPSLRPVNVTIEGWFNFSAANGIRVLVSKTVGVGFFDSFQLWMDTGRLRGAISDAAGFGPFLEHPFVPVLGQWYHIAYTFDDAANAQVLYLDGAPVASGSVTKSIGYDGHPVLIGADIESEVLSFFFAGLSDEVAIHGQALSGAAIQAIHGAGSFGRDAAPPTIICPADVTVGCNESTDLGATGQATGLDDCGIVTVSFSDSLVPDCGNSGVITRTWTATDGCNNSVSCPQIITIVGAAVPSIVCPANVTLECGDSIDPANTGMATSLAGCGAVTVAFVDSFSVVCGTSGLFTRTWTATDACNNVVSCNQLITVIDTTVPAVICPPAVTVECGGSILPAATGMAMATDICSIVTVTYVDSNFAAGCGNSGVITRTWKANDSCNRIALCTQTITLVDTTPPIITCPANLSVACGDSTVPAVTGTATASDACGSATVTFADVVTPGCDGTAVAARTWTATDACGNASTCVQTIQITGIVAASLVCPPDVTLTCGESTDPANSGMATGSQNCGAVTINFTDSIVPGCGDSGVITRTWTATDGCGAMLSCNQIITVLAVPAAVVCAADVTVNCGDSLDPSNTGMLISSGGCGGTTTFIDTFFPDCGSSGMILRTWSVSDDCGNDAGCIQTITISDLAPLVLICPADSSVGCGDPVTPATTGSPTGPAACGTLTFSFSDNFVPDCTGGGIRTRTWLGTDECGNTASCVQTITVIGLAAPSLMCPPNTTVECTASTDPLDTGTALGVHDCANVTVSFSDNFTVGCGAAGVLERTWTATDGCGNMVSCTQVITVVDTLPPTLNCPADVELECGDSTAPALTGQATASDACGTVTVTSSDSSAPGCGGGEIISRTWTATDACGNLATCVQTISLNDTTPPIISCPPGIILECLDASDPSITGTATATDDCSSVTVSFSDLVVPICGSMATIFRVWAATDDCGNSAGCVQIIELFDSTRPSMICPPDVTIECAGSTDPMDTGEATAADLCGSTVVTFSDNFVQGGGPVGLIGTLSRTWMATDDCGNMSECVQTIELLDSAPPSIMCPPDMTLNCADSIDPIDTGSATGSDTCTEVTISFVDSFVPDCMAGTALLTRTWTATDEFGNTTSCNQLFMVTGLGTLILTCPPNVQVNCGESTAPAATGRAIGSGSCSDVTITFADSTAASCGLTTVITRTWTATDGCSISETCVQTITVVDVVPPSVVCPPDVTLSCVDSTAPAQTGSGSATDTCGTATVTFADSFQATCGSSGVITRTWTGIDECGNVATCDQLLTITDTVAPTIVCPANVTVECGASTAPAATGMATGTDICPGAVTIAFSDSFTEDCSPATGTISRSWTATDECGNTTGCVQTIQIVDTTSPTVMCPADRVLTCNDSMDPAMTGTATGTDSCAGVTITFADNFVADCMAGTALLTRTWTATDACGNTATCNQQLLISGLGSPTITCPPNVQVNCGDSTAPAATGSPTASGACSGVNITFTDSIAPTCGLTRVITRTWRATDDCSVSVTCVQTVTVVDTVPPSVVCPPDVTLTCEDSTAPAQTGSGSATDTCGTATVIFADAFVAGCGNSGVITRTWTGTDQCGNVSSCDQLLTIIDTVAPTMTCPVDITITCLDSNDPADTGMPTGSDNCGGVGFTFSDSFTVVGPGTGILVRTWTATDDCGNVANCDQFIQIVGATSLAIVCPSNVTVECTDSTDPADTGMATTIDPCGDVTVTFNDSFAPGCAGDLGTITRTWTATDEVNNMVSCAQIILVEDGGAPTLTCPPDLTVAVDPGMATATVNPGLPMVTDLCDPAPSVAGTRSDAAALTAPYPLGTTVITWVATDCTGNTVSCDQTILVEDPTPRAIIIAERAALVALLPTLSNNSDRNDLQDVIDDLTSAVSAFRWDDDSHPFDSGSGRAVFDRVEDAVKELRNLRIGNQSNIPAAVFQAHINTLVGACRLITEIAIQDAIDRNGNQGKIDDALEQLADGDAEAANDKPDRAVKDYRDGFSDANDA